MRAALKLQVRRRARFRCEYCLFPERFGALRFQIDHVISRQHRGSSHLENLALARLRCNSRKGPNLSGVDPKTGEMVRLFNPRKDLWAEHFRWHRAVLVGLTGVGRATVEVLQINHPEAVLARTALMEEGVPFSAGRKKL